MRRARVLLAVVFVAACAGLAFRAVRESAGKAVLQEILQTLVGRLLSPKPGASPLPPAPKDGAGSQAQGQGTIEALPARMSIEAGQPDEELPTGAATDPSRTVFRFTDADGNLRFVTGIEHVPAPYRKDVKVVSGADLPSYSVAGASVRKSALQASGKGVPKAPGVPGGPWNQDQVRWTAYEEGLRDARRLEKPVFLVFYTGWCPHCHDYEKVFLDPQVAGRSQDFVMIRVDQDEQENVGRMHAPDGLGVPRTVLLGQDGRPLRRKSGKDLYLTGAGDADSVLAVMEMALALK